MWIHVALLPSTLSKYCPKHWAMGFRSVLQQVEVDNKTRSSTWSLQVAHLGATVLQNGYLYGWNIEDGWLSAVLVSMSSSLDALNHHGLQCMMVFFRSTAALGWWLNQICITSQNPTSTRFTGKNPVKRMNTSIRQAMGFSLSWTADITRQVQWRATNIRATRWLPFTISGWISLHRTCQNKGRWIWVERACVTSDMFFDRNYCMLFVIYMRVGLHTPFFLPWCLSHFCTSVSFGLLFFLSISHQPKRFAQ